MHELVNHNGITPDGKRVIAALEGALEAAGTNVAKLNDLPGYVKHYFANVVKMHSMTAEQWLTDFSAQAELVLERLAEADAAQAQQEATVASGMDKALTEFEKRLLDKVSALIREANAEDEDAQTDPAPETPVKASGKAKAKPEVKDAETDSDGESEA